MVLLWNLLSVCLYLVLATEPNDILRKLTKGEVTVSTYSDEGKDSGDTYFSLPFTERKEAAGTSEKIVSVNYNELMKLQRLLFQIEKNVNKGLELIIDCKNSSEKYPIVRKVLRNIKNKQKRSSNLVSALLSTQIDDEIVSSPTSEAMLSTATEYYTINHTSISTEPIEFSTPTTTVFLDNDTSQFNLTIFDSTPSYRTEKPESQTEIFTTDVITNTSETPAETTILSTSKIQEYVTEIIATAAEGAMNYSETQPESTTKVLEYEAQTNIFPTQSESIEFSTPTTTIFLDNDTSQFNLTIFDSTTLYRTEKPESQTEIFTTDVITNTSETPAETTILSTSERQEYVTEIIATAEGAMNYSETQPESTTKDLEYEAQTNIFPTHSQLTTLDTTQQPEYGTEIIASTGETMNISETETEITVLTTTEEVGYEPSTLTSPSVTTLHTTEESVYDTEIITSTAVIMNVTEPQTEIIFIDEEPEYQTDIFTSSDLPIMNFSQTELESATVGTTDKTGYEIEILTSTDVPRTISHTQTQSESTMLDTSEQPEYQTETIATTDLTTNYSQVVSETTTNESEFQTEIPTSTDASINISQTLVDTSSTYKSEQTYYSTAMVTTEANINISQTQPEIIFSVTTEKPEYQTEILTSPDATMNISETQFESTTLGTTEQSGYSTDLFTSTDMTMNVSETRSETTFLYNPEKEIHETYVRGRSFVTVSADITTTQNEPTSLSTTEQLGNLTEIFTSTVEPATSTQTQPDSTTLDRTKEPEFQTEIITPTDRATNDSQFEYETNTLGITEESEYEYESFTASPSTIPAAETHTTSSLCDNSSEITSMKPFVKAICSPPHNRSKSIDEWNKKLEMVRLNMSRISEELKNCSVSHNTLTEAKQTSALLKDLFFEMKTILKDVKQSVRKRSRKQNPRKNVLKRPKRQTINNPVISNICRRDAIPVSLEDFPKLTSMIRRASEKPEDLNYLKKTECYAILMKDEIERNNNLSPRQRSEIERFLTYILRSYLPLLRERLQEGEQQVVYNMIALNAQFDHLLQLENHLSSLILDHSGL